MDPADLAGAAPLLLWVWHMVQTGVQRAFGRSCTDIRSLCRGVPPPARRAGGGGRDASRSVPRSQAINDHLVAAAAHPVLEGQGDPLPSRMRE